MFFGIKEKKVKLGSFTSEQCTSCGEGTTYTFFKITKFFVAFFINLIPLTTRYECECEQCAGILQIDKSAGKNIAKTKFNMQNSEQNALIFLRLLAVAVFIAAAVILPMVLIKPAVTPELLTSIVDGEDGVYTVMNKDGVILASVEIADDEKTLLHYNDMSKLIGEPGAEHGFTMHRNFIQEAITDESIDLKIAYENAGLLEDQYGVPIRAYHYDIATKAYGYSYGIEDLSTIEYTKEKSVYTFKGYSANDEITSSTSVLHIADNRRINTTFEPVNEDGSQLSLKNIIITEYANGRSTKETLYQINDSSEEIVFVGAITTESSAQDIVKFVEQNELKPVYTANYEYYGNTKVYTKIITSLPDQTGALQPTERNFDVVEKDGYYILTPAE